MPVCVHALADDNSISKLKKNGLTDIISTNSVPRSFPKLILV